LNPLTSRLRVVVLHSICILFDCALLAGWLFAHRWIDGALLGRFYPGGTTTTVRVFQFIFLVATLFPVATYLFFDLRSIGLQMRTQSRRKGVVGLVDDEQSPAARSDHPLPVEIGVGGAIAAFWWRLTGFVINFLGATLFYSAVLHMATVISGPDSVYFKMFKALLWMLGLLAAIGIVGTWLNSQTDQIPKEVRVAIAMITLLSAMVLAVPVFLAMGYVT
jgi:hypothetical protein